MKTLTIELSDFELTELGIRKKKISLSEFIDIISTKITKQTLQKSIQLASETKLSELTQDEIDAEIMNYRNEKNNS